MFSRGLGDEIPRQQFIDGVIGNLCEHLAQIAFGIYAVELGRAHQTNPANPSNPFRKSVTPHANQIDVPLENPIILTKLSYRKFFATQRPIIYDCRADPIDFHQPNTPP